MNLSKQLIIVVLLTFFQLAISQEQPKKWKFSFQFDNRFSSIRNNDIVIFGAKIGPQYKNLTRFGLGASSILNPVEIEYTNKKTNRDEKNYIHFWYFSVFNDWILYKNKHWECFVTEQIGFGKPQFVHEVNDDVVQDIKINLFVNEISGQVNYKITSWFGVGTGIGYRKILNQNARLANTFDAPIYIGKIILYPEVFFK